METNTAGAPSGGCLLCGTVKPMLERMWRQATNDHFRNARIECLKGIRSLIDTQIANLSHEEAKGSRVVVE